MNKLMRMVFVDCSDDNNIETIPVNIVLGETCLDFNESIIIVN